MKKAIGAIVVIALVLIGFSFHISYHWHLEEVKNYNNGVHLSDGGHWIEKGEFENHIHSKKIVLKCDECGEIIVVYKSLLYGKDI